MKITICGSSSFRKEMVETKKKLNDLGHEAIVHQDYEDIVAGNNPSLLNAIQTDHAKAKINHGWIKWYYNSIVNSDAILVLNFDKKGIKNYNGGNTLMEIGFAYVNNKKIFLINSVPTELSYYDEIIAMQPIILNNNLSNISLSPVINNTREFFIKNVIDFRSDPYNLILHVQEMERLAKFMLIKYPQADQETVVLSIWLHDIGHYPINSQDHAIVGEKVARNFLETQNIDIEKIQGVAHCVRAHRCKDVMPQTIEAKIIAFIDSLSHMTEGMYLNMIRQNQPKEKIIEKIQRDFRDLSYFPEIKEKMTPLYESWKSLLDSYDAFETESNIKNNEINSKKIFISKEKMNKGIDYIGVGSGAMIFRDDGKVFLAKRGAKARNESGKWDFPGGSVEFGEKCEEAVKREIMEEYGFEIEVIELLEVVSHILKEENQHWVSPSFIARKISGEEKILEPEKCTEIKWVELKDIDPNSLTMTSNLNFKKYLEKFGLSSPKRLDGD